MEEALGAYFGRVFCGRLLQLFHARASSVIFFSTQLGRKRLFADFSFLRLVVQTILLKRAIPATLTRKKTVEVRFCAALFVWIFRL